MCHPPLSPLPLLARRLVLRPDCRPGAPGLPCPALRIRSSQSLKPCIRLNDSARHFAANTWPWQSIARPAPGFPALETVRKQDSCRGLVNPLRLHPGRVPEFSQPTARAARWRLKAPRRKPRRIMPANGIPVPEFDLLPCALARAGSHPARRTAACLSEHIVAIPADQQ